MFVASIILCRAFTDAQSVDGVNIRLSGARPCDDGTESSLYCPITDSYTRVAFTIETTVASGFDKVYEGHWTVLPNQNQGGDDFTETTLMNCDSYCSIINDTATYINVRMPRARVAFPLTLVDSNDGDSSIIGIPYGLFYQTEFTNSTEYNVTSWVMDPAVLSTRPNCTGISSGVSNSDGMCYPNDISLPMDVVSSAGSCGSLYDVTLVNGSNWITFPTGDICRVAVCNNCTQATSVSRVFPFGKQCQLYSIGVAQYFIDVIVTLRTTSVVEPVYFSLEGQGVLRRSNSSWSRGRVKSARFANGFVPQPPPGPSGGYLLVCTLEDDMSVALDQGFFNPWVFKPNRGYGMVPTTNSFGGVTSWAYIDAQTLADYIDNPCNQLGGIGPMTSIYDDEELVQEGCTDGSIRNSACVPGLANNTLSPCQVSSALNEYSQQFLSLPTDAAKLLTKPQFLVPGWNSSEPVHWLHTTRTGQPYLMQLLNAIDSPSIPIVVEFDYDVTNDLLVSNDPGFGADLSVNTSMCSYNQQRGAGYQILHICNNGNETRTLEVAVNGCEYVYANNTSVILQYTQTIEVNGSTSSGNMLNCAYTVKQQITTNGTAIAIADPTGNLSIPTFFGHCNVTIRDVLTDVYYETNTTIGCFILPYVSTSKTGTKAKSLCGAFDLDCAIAIAVLIAGVICGLVILAILITLAVMCSQRNSAKQSADAMSHKKRQ